MRKNNFQFSSVELVFTSQGLFSSFSNWVCFILLQIVSISFYERHVSLKMCFNQSRQFQLMDKKAYLVWRFKDRTPVTDTVRTEVILITLRRVIQCEKFIKDESASLVVYASLYDLNMCILKTKGSTKRTCALPDTKSHSKTTLWKIRFHVTQTSEIPYFEG